jgi:hypothetical protein
MSVRSVTPLLHGKIQQALLLHNLHSFFGRGLDRDGDSIMDHEVFRVQLGKILAGFQRTEDLNFADESAVLLIPPEEGDAELCANEKLVDESRFFNVHGYGGIDKSFESHPVI